jgi:DNA-binding transcriptional LysR family regulator
MDETIAMADVHLFVAVARLASFVGASRRTGVPTSTVSRAIARLEEELGARLLHRTSRKVTLTQEGAWLLARAAPLVDELREVLDGVSDREEEPAGRLRVTAPLVTGAERVGRALIAYAAAYPRVSVELQLTNAVLDLVGEGLDLAFRGGRVTDPDVVARKLWTVPYAMAASPAFVKNRLGGRRRVAAAKLEELPAVVSRPGMVLRFVEAPGAVVEVRPEESFCASDPRVAIEAAKAGLGFVRAPRELVEREGSALVILECELGPLEGRDIFAVYPSRRLLPRRVKEAIDWVVAGGRPVTRPSTRGAPGSRLRAPG